MKPELQAVLDEMDLRTRIRFLQMRLRMQRNLVAAIEKSINPHALRLLGVGKSFADPFKPEIKELEQALAEVQANVAKSLH